MKTLALLEDVNDSEDEDDSDFDIDEKDDDDSEEDAEEEGNEEDVFDEVIFQFKFHSTLALTKEEMTFYKLFVNIIE